jgi:hypothetical protein
LEFIDVALNGFSVEGEGGWETGGDQTVMANTYFVFRQ